MSSDIQALLERRLVLSATVYNNAPVPDEVISTLTAQVPAEARAGCREYLAAIVSQTEPIASFTPEADVAHFKIGMTDLLNCAIALNTYVEGILPIDRSAVACAETLTTDAQIAVYKQAITALQD